MLRTERSYKPTSQHFYPDVVPILITFLLTICSLIDSVSQLLVLTLDTASLASIEVFIHACMLCELAMFTVYSLIDSAGLPVPY